MRKIILIPFLLLLSCFCGLSQNASLFREQLKEHLLTFNFRYESQGNVPLVGNGTVKAQQNCYVVTSGTIEIRCDGKTKWTIDTSAKEIYIEDAEDIFNFLPQLSDIRDEGGKITAKHREPSSGTVTLLYVTDLKSGATTSSDNFSYSVPSGKDWIVTDLRAQ